MRATGAKVSSHNWIRLPILTSLPDSFRPQNPIIKSVVIHPPIINFAMRDKMHVFASGKQPSNTGLRHAVFDFCSGLKPSAHFLMAGRVPKGDRVAAHAFLRP